MAEYTKSLKKDSNEYLSLVARTTYTRDYLLSLNRRLNNLNELSLKYPDSHETLLFEELAELLNKRDRILSDPHLCYTDAEMEAFADGKKMMQDVEMRDLMVSVCKKIKDSFGENAINWSVFPCTETLNEYAYRYDGIYKIEPVSEALCGYVIDIYRYREKDEVSICLYPCKVADKQAYHTAVICTVTQVRELFPSQETIIDIENSALPLYSHVMEVVRDNLYPTWNVMIVSRGAGIYTEQWHGTTLADALLQALNRKREEAKVDIYQTIRYYGKLVDSYLCSERCRMDGYERFTDATEDIYYNKERDVFAVIG